MTGAAVRAVLGDCRDLITERLTGPFVDDVVRRIDLALRAMPADDVRPGDPEPHRTTDDRPDPVAVAQRALSEITDPRTGAAYGAALLRRLGELGLHVTGGSAGESG